MVSNAGSRHEGMEFSRSVELDIIRYLYVKGVTEVSATFVRKLLVDRRDTGHETE